MQTEGDEMATITVRDLDESTRAKLRIRAARNGRSMEAEVREILKTAVATEPSDGAGLGSRIHALFADVPGMDDVADFLEQEAEIEREAAEYAQRLRSARQK